MPKFSFYQTFPDTIKGWEARERNRAKWYAYWAWNAKRRFHALPEDKGIPVPGTGKINYRKSTNGAGVSANSRILPHRYADEGEKGREIRKMVRHRERALWQRDWVAEGYDVEDGVTVSQWFYDNSDDVDSDIIPDVYTVGETVVEWPTDYYDEYGYAYDSYGCYDPYCDICGSSYAEEYDREMMGEYEEDAYCFLCNGPCEF